MFVATRRDDKNYQFDNLRNALIETYNKGNNNKIKRNKYVPKREK